MEKEALIQNLKEKSQIDNLSDRTLDEVATMFLSHFAEDDKITDETWNLPVQMLKTMSGQLRHDLSGGINAFKTKYESEQKTLLESEKQKAIDAFKAEWEKTHPTKKDEGEKGDNDVDKKIADAIANAIGGLTGEEGTLGKLSKQFSDFLNQEAEKAKQNSIKNVRDQIKTYLIGRGVDSDDYALEICLEKLEIGENADVAALKSKAEKDYEAIYNRMHKDDGSRPFKGNGGGGSGGMSPLIKSHIDRVKEQSNDAADYADSIEFAK